MLVRDDVLRRLCRAREILAEVRDPSPTIGEVARAVGISEFHLIRRFESVFGVTPHQFRIQRRLEHAKELLARGDRSVTEICLDVGFSSLGSFSDLFARRIGASPSAYRRRMWSVPARLLAPGCLSLMAALPADAFAVFEKRPPRGGG